MRIFCLSLVVLGIWTCISDYVESSSLRGKRQSGNVKDLLDSKTCSNLRETVEINSCELLQTQFCPATFAQKCQVKALGIESGVIPDSSIIASSYHSVQYPPYEAKCGEGKCWTISPHEANHTNHWLLVDLGKVYTVEQIGDFRGIVENIGKSAVKTYSLQYSNNSKDFIDYNNGKIFYSETFYGKEEEYPPVQIRLKYPFKARYIKFIPKTWFNTVSMCLEVRTKEAGDIIGTIPNKQFTASSYYESKYLPHDARLNNVFQSQNKRGAWKAHIWSYLPDEWLQVDLGKVNSVTGIATQGTPQGPPNMDNAAWTKTYTIKYSNDGKTFYDYLDGKVFQGNTDRDTIVRNDFPSPIYARYIRVYPKTFGGSRMALRIELYGCQLAVQAFEGATSASLATCQRLLMKYIVPLNCSYNLFERICHEKLDKIDVLGKSNCQYLRQTGDLMMCKDLQSKLCRSTFETRCTSKDLGMENGQIQDSQITASTSYTRHIPIRKYRFGDFRYRIWRIVGKNHQGHWLRVDLGKVENLIGMDTFGYVHKGVTEWVETFVLQYSQDGKDFIDYKEGQPLRAGKYNRMYFRPALKARYIKIVPKTWHNRIAFWMELYRYENWNVEPVVKSLSDESFEDSEPTRLRHIEFPANNARLNNNFKNVSQPGAWRPRRSNYYDSSILVDLGRVTTVTGIATQGATDGMKINFWVERYSIAYSSDGYIYQEIRNDDNSVRFYTGNTNRNTIVRNDFSTPIHARYIAVHPEKWNRGIALRMELYGCQSDQRPVNTTHNIRDICQFVAHNKMCEDIYYYIKCTSLEALRSQ